MDKVHFVGRKDSLRKRPLTSICRLDPKRALSFPCLLSAHYAGRRSHYRASEMVGTLSVASCDREGTTGQRTKAFTSAESTVEVAAIESSIAIVIRHLGPSRPCKALPGANGSFAHKLDRKLTHMLSGWVDRDSSDLLEHSTLLSRSNHFSWHRCSLSQTVRCCHLKRLNYELLRHQ